MASITWPNVVSIAAELSTVSADAQTWILAHVNTYYDVDTYGGEDGSQLRLMRLFLAAHLASMLGTSSGGSGGGGGTVTSESGGGLSVTYASSTLVTASNQLSETSYGRTLESMTRNGLARAWVLL